MVSDKAGDIPQGPSLPTCARLPINRCNLPAVILGSLTFQQHPTALHIDGVAELHSDLYRLLAPLEHPEHRAHLFMDYLAAHFLLDTPEEAGLEHDARLRRDKADYLRVLRGWSFDTDGREGAVVKGWVESRFGLLPRYHGAPIRNVNDAAYHAYMEARAQGLYSTNALEAQLDLLYAYCQYELARQHPDTNHLRLYRGVNRLDEHDVLARPDKTRQILLLNNANSFTAQHERADEFGDSILEVDVPLPKILAYSRLLPGRLKSEDEYIVIGGVYEVGTAA